MKRLFIFVCLCALGVYAFADDTRKPAIQLADNSFFDPTSKKDKEESYHFGMEYRIEAGYIQHNQRSKELTYPDSYLHGARLGATFTFLLPLRFSMQVGLLYSIAYNKNCQHWRSPVIYGSQKDSITHRVLEHYLTIPVRAYYTIPLWRQLNLFFYTGPQLQIGLAETDYMDTEGISDDTRQWLISQNIPVETYDRMGTDRARVNIQWGLGGGFEWDCYRLQAGYDFGLNNLARATGSYKRYMAEWGWMVSFSYRF